MFLAEGDRFSYPEVLMLLADCGVEIVIFDIRCASNILKTRYINRDRAPSSILLQRVTKKYQLVRALQHKSIWMIFLALLYFL